MNNEIKVIIVLSVIIAILAGYIIFRELDQRAKDRAYKDNIAKLETTTTELRETNTELGKQLDLANDQIGRVESDYTELEDRYREAQNNIQELENISSQLRKENQGFGEDLAELEELLAWFLSD